MIIPDNIQPREGTIFAKAKENYLRLGGVSIPDCLDDAGRREYLAGINAAKRELGEETFKPQTMINKGTNMKTKLTPEQQIALDEAINEGGAISHIAKALNIAHHVVKYRAEKLGIKLQSARGKYHRKITDDEISAAINAAYPDTEAAEEVEDSDESEAESEILTSEGEYTLGDLLKALGYLFTTVGNLIK